MARVSYAEPSAEELAFRAREGSSPPNLQLAVAHAKEVARGQLELVRAITAGMEPRLKELVILQHARISGNAYCWGHHVPPALAAGLTEVELRALRVGDLDGFGSTERAVLDYVAAVEECRVTDREWADVATGRTSEDLVKLTALVGYYSMTSRVQSALDVAQDDGFGGFDTP
jgi:alkylhydroperoxidase family enzyme